MEPLQLEHNRQKPYNEEYLLQPIMKSIFISDLHLSSDQPKLYDAFETFLNELPDTVNELYILGDLFEAWIGDDDPSDFSFSTKRILNSLSARNIRLKVQRGNRDFLLRDRFAKETGAEILPDHYLFKGYGQKALLMHGDLLCTNDRDYQQFRKKVHNPFYNFILRNLPLKQRVNIAKKWRMQSKSMNKNKPENIMDVNVEAVQACMDNYGVDVLIHGHTHRPDVHEMNGTRGLER